VQKAAVREGFGYGLLPAVAALPVALIDTFPPTDWITTALIYRKGAHTATG